MLTLFEMFAARTESMTSGRSVARTSYPRVLRARLGLLQRMLRKAEKEPEQDRLVRELARKMYVRREPDTAAQLEHPGAPGRHGLPSAGFVVEKTG